MPTKHSHIKTSDTNPQLRPDKSSGAGGHFGQMKFTELFISSSKLISVYTEKTFAPPTDIYETDKEIVIRCEIAGMKPEEINISFDDNNHLLISGCRDERDARVKRNFRQMEINYGKFEKAIEVHCGIEPEKTEAHYKDGFLEVAIPKSNLPAGRHGKSAGHHASTVSDGHITIRHIEIISPPSARPRLRAGGPITCEEGEDE